MKEILDEYACGNDHGLAKAVVPVRMAGHGEDRLISRSRARRLLARVELFRTVLLDFSEVETIGAAFANGIFRVFALQHPEIGLIPVSATPETGEG